MRKSAVAILLGLASAASVAALVHAKAGSIPPPPFELSDAAPTPDALVQRLLAALEKNDESSLHTLRVNEHEYRDLIAPGTAPEGQPPRQTDAKIGEFYWRMLDTKSRDLGRELLKRFGGRKLVIESLEFTKSPQQYTWYRAQGEVRVHVKDAQGAEATIPSGWVAEVDRRYKFIGLNWND